MIAGLEDITSGELLIGGKVVNNETPKDRDIAMVFQSYALYPHMTVRENMGFALKLAKTPKDVINQKVEEAARILDLTQHLDRKPANLSGGQRQRVAMGRAIVRNPAAFLMDEPLSNLDAKLRVQMRTQVSRIQQRLGTTTVYVTHDQVEALTLGDRVAVMRSGLLQQVGTPGELYHRPYNLFVAGFIGSPAMNFLPGHVENNLLRTSLGDFPLTDELRRELEGANTARDVIVGIRPENFEDAAIVPAATLRPGDHVPDHDRRPRVDRLRRLRLLRPRPGHAGERGRAGRAGRRLRLGGHRRRRGDDHRPAGRRHQGPRGHGGRAVGRRRRDPRLRPGHRPEPVAGGQERQPGAARSRAGPGAAEDDRGQLTSSKYPTLARERSDRAPGSASAARRPGSAGVPGKRGPAMRSRTSRPRAASAASVR